MTEAESKLFHQFCDNRSQNGYIFGGFTIIRWSSSGFDKADSSAFLLTLKNSFGLS